MANRGLEQLAAAAAPALNQAYQNSVNSELARRQMQMALSQQAAQQQQMEWREHQDRIFRAEEAAKERQGAMKLEEYKQGQLSERERQALEAGKYAKNPYLSLINSLKLPPEDKLLYETAALNIKEISDQLSGPNSMFLPEEYRKSLNDQVRYWGYTLQTLTEHANPKIMNEAVRRFKEEKGYEIFPKTKLNTKTQKTSHNDFYDELGIIKRK